jgi:hypothetical protein
MTIQTIFKKVTMTTTKDGDVKLSIALADTYDRESASKLFDVLQGLAESSVDVTFKIVE